MLIPFKARRPIHPGRALRHNHHVHKGPLPMSIPFNAQRRNHPGRWPCPKAYSSCPQRPFSIFISFKAQMHNHPAQRHHHRAHSYLLLFIPFKARRHNHRAQKHHYCAQSQLLLFIPFKARRHNHCARRHNHCVLKSPLPLFVSFKAQRTIASKGISIVPNHYWCSFH